MICLKLLTLTFSSDVYFCSMFPQVLFHVLTNFMANFKRLLLNKRGGARDVNCLKLPGSYILLSRHIGLYKHLLRVLHSCLLTNLSLHHH